MVIKKTKKCKYAPLAGNKIHIIVAHNRIFPIWSIILFLARGTKDFPPKVKYTTSVNMVLMQVSKDSITHIFL